MMHQKLGFIGGGNMARSLVGGLIARGLPSAQILVSDPNGDQCARLERQYGIRAVSDNSQVAAAVQVLILAVKPQDLSSVALALAPTVAMTQPLIISVAAGIRSTDIGRWLGSSRVIRAMPNRPALNGCGVTGMYADGAIEPAQRELATRILEAVGKVLWVEDETLMDAVTAISGSGPAYFFLMMELLEKAGVELGLSPQASRMLALETAFGSASMARESSDSPAVLRQQVTSKGGTTEAALRVFASDGLHEIIVRGVKAAASRSAELATQLSSS